MNATALFRADASPAIGAGHVMRCLAFAEALDWAGWNPVFAVNREAGATVPQLAASGHRVLPVEDAELSAAEIEASVAVVDHYGLDAVFEGRLADGGARVVAFDDLADREHACAVLVDPTPGRNFADYRARVPAGCTLLLGPLFSMIRRAWLDQAEASRSRLAVGPTVRRIVVSMGATDPADATSRVLLALAEANMNVDVDIILGPAAPHIATVRAALGPRMTLHIGPPDLPALLATADLAIGAPGSASFERAVLGLPSLVVAIAANQILLGERLAATGAVETVPVALLDDPVALAARIRALVEDGDRRAAMSRAAVTLCDGRGPLRLLVALAGDAAAPSGATVSLRLAEFEDAGWLLALQREPATRRHARNPNPPGADEHATWMRRTLAGSERLLMIILSDGAAAGMLRLDRRAGPPLAFEVSIAVSADHRGRGIGKVALALVRRFVPAAGLVAVVAPENRASIALFRAAGYAAEGPDCYWNRAA